MSDPIWVTALFLQKRDKLIRNLSTLCITQSRPLLTEPPLCQPCPFNECKYSSSGILFGHFIISCFFPRELFFLNNYISVSATHSHIHTHARTQGIVLRQKSQCCVCKYDIQPSRFLVSNLMNQPCHKDSWGGQEGRGRGGGSRTK